MDILKMAVVKPSSASMPTLTSPLIIMNILIIPLELLLIMLPSNLVV